MKHAPSARLGLTLLVFAALTALLGSSALAGNRRTTRPPPPISSGAGPAVSLP